jgi:hypothetical protein
MKNRHALNMTFRFDVSVACSRERADEIIETARKLFNSFGGMNLESRKPEDPPPKDLEEAVQYLVSRGIEDEGIMRSVGVRLREVNLVLHTDPLGPTW